MRIADPEELPWRHRDEQTTAPLERQINEMISALCTLDDPE
jgi:hypothetical protein